MHVQVFNLLTSMIVFASSEGDEMPGITTWETQS